MANKTTYNPKETEIAIAQLVKLFKCLLKDGHTIQLKDLHFT